jgi:hypothetical protein
MIIDTDTNCTRQVTFLVQRGVEHVGRYYASSNGPKVIKKAEARALSAKGIRIFTVFEDAASKSKLDLSEATGKKHGATAKRQAAVVGQPNGTVIYFAVEGLPSGYKTADLPAIRGYFNGVHQGLEGNYTAGVYGDGIVCETLLGEGICSHTWLAQASYSFQGSQRFYASKQWNIAQIVTDLPKKNWRGLSVDINEGSADMGSFLVPVEEELARSQRRYQRG